jgi:hypothetical protein
MDLYKKIKINLTLFIAAGDLQIVVGIRERDGHMHG